MATWPTTLPAPDTDGYSIAPQASFARTDMDQGPARQRRRFTTAPTHYSVQWVLTEAQLATLESWYLYQADDGAAWFSISLRNGAGLQPVEARFMEPFQASKISGYHYQVSATLEVRNRPVSAWTGG